MLTIYFEHDLIPDAYRVGPAAYFRLTGRSLIAGPQGEEVACYRGGQWHVGGRTFPALMVRSPVTVQFDNDGTSHSDACGPLNQVKVAEGAIWHGPGCDKLLARLDEESQTWHSEADQRYWITAVLAAASR